MELSREVAQKVLDIVDAGLLIRTCNGIVSPFPPEPAKVCYESPVSYAPPGK